MPVRFISFSSGSSGNCYYIGNNECSVLIDAGVSLRRLRTVMKNEGLSIEDVDAILVTHDHMDHIRHLASVTKRFGKPVYTTPVLCAALKRHTATAGVVDAYLRPCACGEYSFVKGMSFMPVPVPHDATETVGYHIDFYGEKITFLTDIGRITDEAVSCARESSHIVIESNYDVDMLVRGPYTAQLKQRIMGGSGHLSNDECASFVKRVYHNDMRHIFLCHISDNNNTKEMAYRTVSKALKEIGVVPGGEVMLYPLPRRGVSNVIDLR